MFYKNGNNINFSYKELLNNLTPDSKIVFTNGVFDILHIGHVEYLKNAAAYGDFLIVGLNSNLSVKKLNKASERPIVDEDDRAKILSCLYFVDLVIIFNEANPEELIKNIKPSIYIKGGDYDVENIPETDLVQSYGGVIKKGLYVKGKSSSLIISQLYPRRKTLWF